MSRPADLGSSSTQARVAYFSMEIALEPELLTYSGGLGVLAGDTLRGAADLGVPMVAVTLVHRKGYVEQRLAANGEQLEVETSWSPEAKLEELRERVRVTIEGKEVLVRAFRYDVRGTSPQPVTVLLLDVDLAENAPEHRRLTDHLYGG
ncbi:MAG TPA: hypothetical protein VM686_06190, partial [Polyangiaceae bacterium]|nr:hypothetical protein [Polyangiaceae bacterium]